MFIILALLYIAMIVAPFAGLWKLYEKANKPGWAAIVPFYNFVVWLEIIGKPVWHIILLFIPFVNIYVCITMTTGLCKSFGKPGMGNYMAAIFLGFIYFPYLGF